MNYDKQNKDRRETTISSFEITQRGNLNAGPDVYLGGETSDQQGKTFQNNKADKYD